MSAGVLAQGALADSRSLPFPLSLPPGFTVELVSSRIGPARFLAVAPNGDVLVSQMSLGRVVALQAGAPPEAEPRIVARGLERPNGLAFHGADLYIATWTGVVVVPDYPTGPGKAHSLFSSLPRSDLHNARSLAIAGDGSVFISSGSDCNVCTEGDSRLATVFRFSADGSSGGVFARGLRNASGLAFDSSGRLWAVVNQRDSLRPDHTDLPPDELDLIVQGGNYGWPSSYSSGGARLPNPEYPGATTESFVPAAFEFQAHSAPLQAAFCSGSLFPEKYRGALFVAFHGSWNRDPPTGYKVVVLFFDEGKPVSIADFATGWLVGRTVRGRPVGLAFAPDGSMYISDDTGLLFRVVYKAPESGRS